MKFNITAVIITALFCSACNPFASDPDEKYKRLIKDLSDSGFTDSQIGSIDMVAFVMAVEKVCGEKAFTEKDMVPYMIRRSAESSGIPQAMLLERALPLVKVQVEKTQRDPTAKENMCSPTEKK